MPYVISIKRMFDVVKYLWTYETRNDDAIFNQTTELVQEIITFFKSVSSDQW